MNLNDKTVYIIDTNVFLQDPDCLDTYKNSIIVVPISVIEELDQFKTRLTETGRNARRALELIESLRGKGSLKHGVPYAEGNLLLVPAQVRLPNDIPPNLDMSKNPNKTLAAALLLREDLEISDSQLIVVTNDSGLRIRSAAFGIGVAEYGEQRASKETVYETFPLLTLSEEDENFIQTNSALKFPADLPKPYPNQFFQIKFKSGDSMLGRYYSKNDVLRLVSPSSRGYYGIHPRNFEQLAAFEILSDPNVHICMLAGKAGTGKTLVALASSLEQVFSGKRYRKILVSRPIVPMGRELGFLPGELSEKLSPWMQPIFDNLDYLINNSGANRFDNHKQLIDKGIMEIEALSYIRGRSIPNRIMIVDESQNLTPHEIKTIITRCGDGTKLILTGDPFQIDNPYLDAYSNGLTHAIEKFRNQEISGHVNLINGERSPLAELAADIL